jgi:hypothetical protein
VIASWQLPVGKDQSAMSFTFHSIQYIAEPVSQNQAVEMPYLRNTLLVLSSEKDSPGNATRVLALQEEGFGLAILESEDLAITADVELALHIILSAFHFL